MTKGPSLDPTVKRLAVQTEDHPLDYGDFEGTIPEGQYGGGTVQLWDRGYWLPIGDPHEGLKRGDLKFVLEGERLHGSWVLVRMKWDRKGGSGKKSNWLLIKHRDEAAREGDEDERPGGESDFRRVRPHPGADRRRHGTRAHAIHDRQAAGGRCGLAKQQEGRRRQGRPRGKQGEAAQGRQDADASSSRSSASWSSARPSQAGWAHEVKFDGYRLQLRVEDGEATLRTRKGLDWTEKFQAIAKQAAKLPDCMIDGEAVALDAHGVPDFSALQAALSEGQSDKLVFFAFDLLFADGEDLRALPLRDRKARLQDAARRAQGQACGPAVRRAFRDGGRRGAGIGVPHEPRRHRLQGARRALSLRPRRQLGQDQVPGRP